ncbi:non-canonical purine NTP pyrophosphatase [Aliarcobacter butzleri]|uniref:non-canonical purine NTP pyrophosphatase n=1 Tax=Aliarcobacter butzleri TaxID=28197 RepID=UPI0024DE5F5B|nr:non-canonical purine NTP pyrophosphatase [Aliarcobacter butzleri]MDK2082618.1 non-canonical purine NTP pyrophosphatase [Aliarcobacter butzleri]
MLIDIAFITSSKTKREHIKYLCKDYNINIVSQKNYGIGYNEPRIMDREKLLKESYDDALARWNKHVTDEEKMFIIEDTSVKIDILSTKELEYPGLDIKYWMKENDFESVDHLLKEKGNKRTCSVRSDIILHLSKSLQKKFNKSYLQFTGKVKGKITSKEYTFDTNLSYPWLDNKTFNKWFIPQKALHPLGTLSIKDADKYDFRRKAIIQLLEFLESEKLIKPKNEIISYKQKIINFSPLLILCGPTCSGKSTLADYISNNYNYFHIEASDFMWLKYYETHGINSGINIGDFAKNTLSVNPYIVAEQIIEYFQSIDDQPIVISGFRNPDEIKYISEKCQYSYIELLYIDSDIKIRFDREIKRGRLDAVNNFESFLKKDNLQHEIGLKLISEKIKHHILNENSLDDFYYLFNKKFLSSMEKNENSDFTKIPLFDKMTLENAIILALFKNDGEYTTTEIAKLIDKDILASTYKNRKNNVSRYFNFNFHPYYDCKIDAITKINKYKLNSTGKSFAKRILRKNTES